MAEWKSCAEEIAIPPFRPLEQWDVAREVYPERYRGDEAVQDEQYSLERNAIPVGTTRNGGIYTIDGSQSFRLLVIGPTGKGKTWVIRGVCDWLNYLNWLLLIVNDTANEYITSLEPNRKHQLPEFAKPRGNPRLRRWTAEWVAPDWEKAKFSLRIADLDAMELQYLLGITDNSPKQLMVLDEIVAYFDRQRKRDPDYKVTIRELTAIRRNPAIVFEGYDTEDRLDKEAVGEPLANIYYRLLDLLKKKVVETDNRLKPLDLITGEDGVRDRHVILDWSAEKLKKIRDPASLSGTCMSVIVDRLYEARKIYRVTQKPELRVPPFFVVWDEAQPFIIKDSANFPSTSMGGVVTQGRKEGVGAILGFQKVGQVDETYLSNAEHAFIFSIAGAEELATIAHAFPNIYPENMSGRTNISALADMQGHEFLAINSTRKTWQFVTSFPPLSRHMEENARREIEEELT